MSKSSFPNVLPKVSFDLNISLGRFPFSFFAHLNFLKKSRLSVQQNDTEKNILPWSDRCSVRKAYKLEYRMPNHLCLRNTGTLRHSEGRLHLFCENLQWCLCLFFTLQYYMSLNNSAFIYWDRWNKVTLKSLHCNTESYH